MKASKLKAIGKNLGRFASVRENAPFPMDRILVQAKDGVLKMVAIAPYGTLIATMGDTTDEYRVILGAREFLQYVDSLPAKGEIDITPAKDDWEHGINIGKRFFERIGTGIPADVIMPRLEAMPGGYVDVPDAEAFGKMVDSVSAKWSKGVQFNGAIVTGKSTDIEVAVWDSYKYGSTTLSGEYEVFGWVDAEYINAVKGLGPYRLDFDPANRIATVRAEGYTAYGRYNFLSVGVPSLREAGLQTPTTHAVVDRTAFKKEVREQARLDNYERVVLQYTDGTLRALPYEEDTQEWAASGRFLIQLLDGSKTKRVGFGLREPGSPISLKVDAWIIELAPVKQLKRKSIDTPKTTPVGIYAD